MRLTWIKSGRRGLWQNVLGDTNVILDFFLSREPQKEAATKLFEQIIKKESEPLPQQAVLVTFTT